MACESCKERRKIIAEAAEAVKNGDWKLYREKMAQVMKTLLPEK